MQKGGFLLILLLAGTSLNAQTTIGQWLATAIQDPSVKNSIALLEYRKDNPQTIKWLDKIELRSETREFELNQQQYGLRVYGTRWSSLKAQKNLELHMQEVLQLEAAKSLHKALHQRYKLVLDWYLVQNEFTVLMVQDSFYAKKIKYLESLIQHQLMDDVKDWIQSVHKNDRLALRKNQLNQRQDVIIQEMKALGLEGNLQNDLTGWITPEQVIDLVAHLNTEWPRVTDYQKYQLDLSKLSIDRSQQKSKQWDILDFVQARWRNNANDEFFKEKFSIGAGFKLPYSGTSKKEWYDFQFKEYKLKIDAEASEREFYTTAQVLLFELKSIFTLIQAEKLRLERFSQTFQSARQLQVNDLLLIEETILDMNVQVMELTQKLYVTYLRYLDHTQWISQMTLKNYFHYNLPNISKE